MLRRKQEILINIRCTKVQNLTKHNFGASRIGFIWKQTGDRDETEEILEVARFGKF